MAQHCFNPHSPLLANELMFAQQSHACGPRCFNPHSPLLANELGGGCELQRPSQSFNPHSPLLANELVRLRQSQHQASGFNPHSPLLANEFDKGFGPLYVIVVSIHIRHCWRMNSDKGFGPLYVIDVSIHIRHCWRMNSAWQAQNGGFMGSFNPHSPLLANELCVMSSGWR